MGTLCFVTLVCLAFSGGSIFEMFKDAPNLKVLSDLMNEMPELMETLIYQNSQEPQRVSFFNLKEYRKRHFGFAMRMWGCWK